MFNCVFSASMTLPMPWFAEFFEKLAKQHPVVTQSHPYTVCFASQYPFHNHITEPTGHMHEERLGNILENCEKPRQPPGIEPGASDFSCQCSTMHLSYGHRVRASLHNSQYHSVCAVRTPLHACSLCVTCLTCIQTVSA